MGRRIIYWLLTGIVLSLSIASMVMTRDGNLGKFYDDGAYQNLKDSWMRQAYNLGMYDLNQNLYYTNLENADLPLSWSHANEEFHYIVLDLEVIQADHAHWRLSYYDENWKEIEMIVYPLKNGKMIIPLENIDYSYRVLRLQSAGVLKYKVNDFYISEYVNPIREIKVIKGGAICFLIYAVITLLIPQLWRNRKNRLTVFCRNIEKLMNSIFSYLGNARNQEGCASWIRIGLFCLIFINGKFVSYYGWSYAVFYNCIFWMLLVYWIPIEGNSTNKNRYLLLNGGIICVMQVVSDLLIKKNFDQRNFCGAWIFICVGLFYYAWGRMKRPQQLLEELLRAVEIYFVILLLQCLLGDSRKSIEGYMTGIWGNQNPFSLEMVVFLAVFLFRLYQQIVRKRWRSLGLVYFAAAAVSMWLIFQAAGRTALVMAACEVLVFVLYAARAIGKRFFASENRKASRRKLWIVGILGCAAVALVFWRFGAELVVQTNTTFGADSFFSGRVNIWITYLKNLNLLGHGENILFPSKVIGSHNEILMQMYRYGVFIGIFVIAFLLEVIRALWNMVRNQSENEYVLLAVLIVIAYILQMPMEMINEDPLKTINWWMFLIVIGYIVQEKDLGHERYKESGSED